MILVVKKSAFAGSDVTAAMQSHSLHEYFRSGREFFPFSSFPLKSLKYIPSVFHIRGVNGFLERFFFFWMVKGNHFTTSTPLWAASESLTYHRNFVNALLFNDLASARADVQFVPRNAVPQHFCMLHVWQHLHQAAKLKFIEWIYFPFFSPCATGWKWDHPFKFPCLFKTLLLYSYNAEATWIPLYLLGNVFQFTNLETFRIKV